MPKKKTIKKVDESATVSPERWREGIQNQGVVKTYTVEELSAMLAAAQQDAGLIVTDPTMDLPTGSIPAHLIADKSALPSPESRTSSPVQPPARLWGNHSLSGPSPILADVQRPQSLITNIQPGQLASTISPPPMKHFGRGQ